MDVVGREELAEGELHPRTGLHAGEVVDVGELGGRLFVSIAGIGFDAHVAREFDRAGSRRRGFRTYVRVTAQELWRYRCGNYRVDGVAAARALLVTFANSAQFGNGARIAPGARLDDGLLDMVIFEERSRLATLRALAPSGRPRSVL